MGTCHQDDDLSKIPARFYDRLIRDIPATTWVGLLASDPILKKEVLEGFSMQAGKLSWALSQPRVMGRLHRKLQTDRSLLKEILAEWKKEQPSIISFLSMLDTGFMAENSHKLNALLGPERFCLGLFSLGLLNRQWAIDAIEAEDAMMGSPDVGIFDLLAPVLYVWGGFIERNPELSRKFLETTEEGGFLFDLEEDQAGQDTRPDPDLKERFRKVEKKLQKNRSDLVRTVEQLHGLRIENEDLRKKVREFEAAFEKKLNESLAQKRKEWFERYQDVDLEETAKESGRLESLLQRTRRALELQKRADEEYGLVSEIRAELLEIDRSLARIEAVYADSLVVHKEVEKVKDALLSEKERLLKLPGIKKAIQTRHSGEEIIIGRINLLDPVPANLSGINKLLKLVGVLSESELAGDPALLEEAARHKKRQIMERLYAQFEPGREDQPRERRFRDLKDFIDSGQSKSYNLFVDGYNVLLRVHGGEEGFPGARFTQLREQFIEAVAARSGHFAKVFLIFDGVENSTGIQANTEIIYTDNTESSADAAIIERVNSGRAKKVLLVTGDEGIISSVQDRIFALVDVAAFYMFLFE